MDIKAVSEGGDYESSNKCVLFMIPKPLLAVITEAAAGRQQATLSFLDCACSQPARSLPTPFIFLV